LNKRERVLDDERACRDRSEKGNEEFSYLIRIMIDIEDRIGLKGIEDL
jgi:hypothetical protein